MLIHFFVILFVSAIACLLGGIKYKKWLLTMFATILFLTLALQAFRIEVPSGGITIVFQEIVLVLINWLGGFVSFIYTLVGLADYLKNRNNPQSGMQGR